MRKHILYPLLALLLGVCGALSYWKLLLNPADGLPSSSEPAAMILIVLCIAAGALSLLCALRSRGMQAGALYSTGCTIRAGLLLGSAGLLLVSTMLQLLDVMGSVSGGASPFSLLLELILIVVSIPTVVCIAFLAKDAKTGGGRSHGSLTVVIPIFYCWVWLIEVYRHHTADPILWNYVFLLMAVVFLLISICTRAGFSFGDGRPRLAVFSSMAAIFLAPISLISFSGLSTLCATLGLTLYVAVFLSGLLRNVPMPELSESEIQTEVSDDE